MLTVIANDFVPIEPYDTEVVTLGIGQRTDILVTGLNNATGGYLMRSSIASAPCSASLNPDATAIVYYDPRVLAGLPPNTTPWPAFLNSVATICGNVSL